MRELEVRLTVMSGDYADAPSVAKILFSLPLVKRIKALRTAVMKIKADTIGAFDYSPDWFNDSIDDELEAWDGSIRSLQMIVTDGFVQWEGLIKHTNDTISTESISMDTLQEIEMLLSAQTHADLWKLRKKIKSTLVKPLLTIALEKSKVLEAPRKELLLLMGHLETDAAKELLEQRLKSKDV